MERHIGLHIIIIITLFPSLSLSPLIGPLKHGVCVCFVLFVLSGCYVVMLCEKKKKMLIKKKKELINCT